MPVVKTTEISLPAGNKPIVKIKISRMVLFVVFEYLYLTIIPFEHSARLSGCAVIQSTYCNTPVALVLAHDCLRPRSDLLPFLRREDNATQQLGGPEAARALGFALPCGGR